MTTNESSTEYGGKVRLLATERWRGGVRAERCCLANLPCER